MSFSLFFSSATDCIPLISILSHTVGAVVVALHASVADPDGLGEGGEGELVLAACIAEDPPALPTVMLEEREI